jgi:hypothetical protein
LESFLHILYGSEKEHSSGTRTYEARIASYQISNVASVTSRLATDAGETGFEFTKTFGLTSGVV